MKPLLIFLLRAYQLTISPMLGQKCRFFPTCSNYALEALRVHGAARGSWLATKRVCKCHPWHPGGVDLVPGPSGPVSRCASAPDPVAKSDVSPDVNPDLDPDLNPDFKPSTARGCNHS